MGKMGTADLGIWISIRAQISHMQWVSSLLVCFGELDLANNVLDEQPETGQVLGITKAQEAYLDMSVDACVG
jgi:hypothetical protein